MALLIPPYVTEVTSDAAAAGSVMAVISLAAVLGPVLGTFADRHGAHRIVMSLGVLGMAVGSAAFAFASDSSKFYASIRSFSAVDSGRRGCRTRVHRRRRAAARTRGETDDVVSLSMPAGQVVGGLSIGAAAAAGWSYSNRFWIASVFSRDGGGHLADQQGRRRATARGDVSRQRRHRGRVGRHQREGEGAAQSRAVVVVWTVLVGDDVDVVANNGINSQISNIMPNVYGISEAETSTLISLAGLLNIALFIVAGKMMATAETSRRTHSGC